MGEPLLRRKGHMLRPRDRVRLTFLSRGLSERCLLYSGEETGSAKAGGLPRFAQPRGLAWSWAERVSWQSHAFSSLGPQRFLSSSGGHANVLRFALWLL